MNSNSILNDTRTLTRGVYCAVAVAVVAAITALETSTPQCRPAPKPSSCNVSTTPRGTTSSERITNAFDDIGRAMSPECNPSLVCTLSPLHNAAVTTAWIVGVLALLLIARLVWMRHQSEPNGYADQFDDRHDAAADRYTNDPWR